MLPVRSLFAPFALLALGLTTAGCEGGRARAPGTGTARPAADAGAADGSVGAGADATAGDGSTASDSGPADAGPTGDGGPPPDAGLTDAGFVDAGSPPDSGPPAGAVNLTFTGCGPDFNGEIVVSYNGSLGIGALGPGGVGLMASLQFDLGSQRGLIPLSTRHRVDTGLVVNLVAPNTWTNIAQDSRVYTGEIPDPIGGTLQVDAYQASAGVSDITFSGVTLQNVVDDSICRIDGRVTSDRIGR